MTGLTTHVLDLSHGLPASQVRIDLFRIDEDDREYLGTSRTNEDGRLSHPLLKGGEMERGIYEVVFYIGEYFQRKRKERNEPHFLTTVPVRFGISDPSQPYHVPLLVSPWGYQVYRGS
ncbi:hydroxyisourate hydrolase [Halobacillus salinarum]|uniref:5-hydroxyisourate hydrolase n=1 Tax=Halobacillus salinarum TaxID=2932257 RepID=A0ABY4EJ84_9BACI|nr:hydroxyisourate hydrolase [Halobacillus salinarum]UOQ43694.1 hydroxyisourate hydrolase [Halobacillus salinarum]